MSGLAAFIRSLETGQRKRLAKAAGTSPAMLDQYAGEHKRPGYRMAQRLVDAARRNGFDLSLHDCRPDIWDEAA